MNQSNGSIQLETRTLPNGPVPRWPTQTHPNPQSSQTGRAMDTRTPQHSWQQGSGWTSKIGSQRQQFRNPHAAKIAEENDNTPIILPISKSALNQQFNKWIRNEAKRVMSTSPRYPSLCKIDPSAPSKHYSLLIAELPRHHSSLLFQLRTGHIPLNKHLHCITKVPTPICQQCHQREETVHHFLLVCPSYARQCHILT